MMETIMHAIISILLVVIGLWAVGRCGPMTIRTRPGDIAALVSLAIGAFGSAGFNAVHLMPPVELLLMLFGGLAWWLMAEPAHRRHDKYAPPAHSASHSASHKRPRKTAAH